MRCNGRRSRCLPSILPRYCAILPSHFSNTHRQCPVVRPGEATSEASLIGLPVTGGVPLVQHVAPRTPTAAARSSAAMHPTHDRSDSANPDHGWPRLQGRGVYIHGPFVRAHKRTSHTAGIRTSSDAMSRLYLARGPPRRPCVVLPLATYSG